MPVSAHEMTSSRRSLTCPQCRKTKLVTMQPQQLSRPTLRVKCPCGAQFDIPCQQRAFPRRRVTLTGHLFAVSTDSTHTRTCRGEIRIYSLALGGLSFLPTTPALGEKAPLLTVGDHYIVVFTLDNAESTPLEMGICIRHIHGHAVGAAFTDDTPYSYDLDFYLTS
jgi:hypothetical protein